MIQQSDLDPVLNREPKINHRVLSVYLDINQSQARNHSRGFEPAMRAVLRPVGQQIKDEAEHHAFEASLQRMAIFIKDYTPGAPSIAMFCDNDDDFFWQREFRVPLRNCAHWDEAPYARPLKELLDEYARYGVVLADRHQARFFSVFLREVEEYPPLASTEELRHARSVTRDQLLSESKNQRYLETRTMLHLKQVAESVDRWVARQRFDRLILGGPGEMTAELNRLLPMRLHSMVVRNVPLAIDSTPLQVLDVTSKVETELERELEQKTVRELTVTAVKNPRAAVIGLEPTLKALQSGRVWKLAYAERLEGDGAECQSCGALFATPPQACDYCGGIVQPVEDLTDRLVDRVGVFDGRLEVLREESAEQLLKFGGIGAFLRF